MGFQDELARASQAKDELKQDPLSAAEIQSDLQQCESIIEVLCAEIKEDLLRRAREGIIDYDTVRSGFLVPKEKRCNPKYSAYLKMGYQFDYDTHVCRIDVIPCLMNDGSISNIRGVICNSPEIVIGILSEVVKRLETDKIYLVASYEEFEYRNCYRRTERVSLNAIADRIRKQFQTQEYKSYWKRADSTLIPRGHFATDYSGYEVSCNMVSFIKKVR